ncbi:Phospho-2-dehydro-3-deoxyheptonate aldolase 2 [Abeliophyllum distichum]|uniref:Phospho-2-dehydro-3-deoxyheptonate aldolase n=1 Tax=Abeliophyllum distichum TaxID=126358 RepID=A0ABD1U270_9LAMI
MALTAHNSLLPNKYPLILQTQHSLCTNSSSLAIRSTTINHISAVHPIDSSNSKNLIVSKPKPLKPTPPATAVATATVDTKAPSKKWILDGWKSKKALQLLEYPNDEELDSVLKTLDDFPPIVFAGEARSLESSKNGANLAMRF